jgi:hypothetical protein
VPERLLKRALLTGTRSAESIMASGHVKRRSNRPDTWQLRPAMRYRSKNPCQHGAVHTWHIADSFPICILRSVSFQKPTCIRPPLCMRTSHFNMVCVSPPQPALGSGIGRNDFGRSLPVQWVVPHSLATSKNGNQACRRPCAHNLKVAGSNPAPATNSTGPDTIGAF